MDEKPSKRRHRVWAFIQTEQGLALIQTIGIIGTLLVSTIGTLTAVVYSAVTLRQQHRYESAQLIQRFDDELNDTTNLDIEAALEKGEPILRENGGKHSDDDLDDLLSAYEDIDNAYVDGLLADDMIESAFSYDLAKAARSDEIRTFVAECRKDDPTLYTGFDDLAKRFGQ